MKIVRSLTLAALALAPAAAPLAADQPKIVLTVDVQQEISRAGASGKIEVVRQPAEKAGPGDVLVYTLTYKNVGQTPASNARVDDPIPTGTVLLPMSLTGSQATITVSVDGGKTFTSYPARQNLAGPDGKPVQTDAPAEAYTHLRWTATQPLAPGESRTASFKVLVR